MADEVLRAAVFALLRERVAGDQVDDVDVRGAVLDVIDLVRAHPRRTFAPYSEPGPWAQDGVPLP